MTGNYSNTSGPVTDTIHSGTIAGTVDYYGNSLKPVPDVTLDAPGTTHVSTNTGGTGSYSLSGFGGGAYTVTPSRTAQLCTTDNGIFADDASMVSQYVVNLITLTDDQKAAAKVSGNLTPNLSSFDAALIAQKVVGICDPGNLAGIWAFNPANVAHPSGIITNYTENYTAYVMGDVSGDWDVNASPNRPVGTATANAVAASLPRTLANAGTEVTIPLRIDNLAGRPVGSFQFDVVYDPAIAEPAQIAANVSDTLSSNLSVVSNTPTPGLLKVAVYGAFPATGDGIYANLKFTVRGAAGTSTPLTIQRFRLNSGIDEVMAVHGHLTVTAPGNNATLRGHVLTSDGHGLRNAIVTVTSTLGQMLQTTSDSFGGYQFAGLAIGDTYTVNVRSKHYRFGSRVVSLMDSVTDVEMVGEE